MRRFLPLAVTLALGIAIGFFINGRDHGAGSAVSASGETDAASTGHEGHEHGPDDGHDHGATAATATTDWCMEHRVPESACTKCNPALVAQFKAANDWCVEHGLPESHCRLCNPNLEFPQEAAIRAMQPKPELGISIFFPENQALCATDGALIQFASAETFSRTGLTIEPVREATVGGRIEAPAEVVFNQESATMLTLPVRTAIRHWMVEPGEVVAAGRMIALCESPEAAHLKGEYLEACAAADQQQKNFSRQEELRRRDLIDAATLEIAEAEANSARARQRSAEHELRALGLNDDDLAEVRADGKLTARFALRAPSSGTLVERSASIGIALEEGTPLATIANPSDLWIEARVRDTDLQHVRLGQPVVFTSDGDGLDRTEGRVIWVSQFLDPSSRTGIVRAIPASTAASLRARQFGHLDLIEPEDEHTLLVPKDAVQWEGCCHVVFVREADDRFRPRKVSIGKGDADHYRILAGVSAEDWVVVHGSFLLKTELKKSSIGAGCCGLDAKS